MDDGYFNGASQLRGLRVLIVEDSWHMATSVRSLLEDAGMIITGPAATTTDAERLVGEGFPALAVVDVKLRDGMAYRLIDHLNELGIRVVVVTGFATFSEPLAKAAAIVQKPVVKDELLAALCGVLPAILQ